MPQRGLHASLDGPGNLAVRHEDRDDNLDVIVLPRQVTQCPAVHVDREPVPDSADWLTGGVHEHAGGVDVDVTAWIPENSEDLAGRRGDQARHLDARGLLLDIGHPASMSPEPRASTGGLEARMIARIWRGWAP